MPPLSHTNLSRRERQIMDVLYESAEASAHDVQDKIPDAPGYSAVRALIARLVEKGLVSFRQEGAKYIYFPTVAQSKASLSAIERIVKTFFKGSRAKAMNALLDLDGDDLSAREIEELERNIARIKSLKKGEGK
ncbi:BlaI/MecI/CopY family transcriptional regulator [Teredinibacter franksiae]|uniref:BlaI/MecI/CopY family transcriptional regulator n=1 Tax=Teredinibacter franksiae TaxID=2761453 RepID=UPI0016232832|nr:BlaI/MecI/CopY family transcriptional regulator [Teredinibacter franksiae]